jgi:hypothetical protein
VKAKILFLLLLASSALADQPTWTLASGKTLRMETSNETKKLVDNSDSVLAPFTAAEQVQGAVLSEGRTCILLLVFVERLSERSADRRGFDYGYLLRVTSDASGWHVTRHLDQAAPPMNELHRFVSELGAVSDDGKTALLKFGAANREHTPYTMDYVWQTWDLDAPKLLGTGLRLEHAKR